MYISKLALSRPPSASLSYPISKCISKLAQSWLPTASVSSTQSRPPSASPNSVHHGLQVHPSLIRSWPPNASANSLDHRLHVHPCVELDLSLQVHPWVTRSQPRNPSPYPLDHGLQVHLWVQLDLGLQVHLETGSIVASKYITPLTRSRPPSTSPNSLNQSLLVLLRWRSSTICRQIGHMYIFKETWIDNACHIMM